MNFYEHTIVAKQDLSSNEIENIQEKYNDIINKSSGKVVKIENWGLLNFARRIKNHNKGFYIHYKFEGNSKVKEFVPILCYKSTAEYYTNNKKVHNYNYL